MHNDIAGWSIGDDLALGEHHRTMRHGGHHLDIVGGHDHRTTFGGKTFEHGDESLLGAVVQTTGGLIEQDECRFGAEHDGEHERKALTLGEIPGMGPLVDAGDETIEHGPGGAGGEVAVAIGGDTFGSDGVVIKQNAIVLRNQTH